jgi:hypothetical protein
MVENALPAGNSAVPVKKLLQALSSTGVIGVLFFSVADAGTRRVSALSMPKLLSFIPSGMNKSSVAI